MTIEQSQPVCLVDDELDINSFIHLTNPELIISVKALSASLTNNPHFPDDKWPEEVPKPLQLDGQCDVLAGAITSANVRPQERDKIRGGVLQSVKFTLQYVKMRAAWLQEPAVIKTVNAAIKHKKSVIRAKAVEGHLALSRGEPGSGSIFVKTAIPKLAETFEIQYSLLDPPTEESWVVAKRVGSGTRFEIKNLPPGSRPLLRGRAHYENGPGDWTPVVSIVVF